MLCVCLYAGIWCTTMNRTRNTVLSSYGCAFRYVKSHGHYDYLCARIYVTTYQQVRQSRLMRVYVAVAVCTHCRRLLGKHKDNAYRRRKHRSHARTHDMWLCTRSRVVGTFFLRTHCNLGNQCFSFSLLQYFKFFTDSALIFTSTGRLLQ